MLEKSNVNKNVPFTEAENENDSLIVTVNSSIFDGEHGEGTIKEETQSLNYVSVIVNANEFGT